MSAALMQTDFDFSGQTHFYRGKVRDAYTINDTHLIMVATDRISAFDVVLPRGIPSKGQVLNQIAADALRATKDVVPNWLLSTPHPNVSIGYKATPFPVEMVIRGYLSGHAWREYKEGRRELCGVTLPEGLQENERLPEPIITPTTKAHEGHDEDISAADIVANQLVSKNDYLQLEHFTRTLFVRGTEIAAARGLILVDTKYEFGKTSSGEIVLIDEIHTPDSSRFFYADGYEERQAKSQPQRQLSKEFVREWLMEHGFSGQPGQTIPDMDDAFVQSVSERYRELYENICGAPYKESPVDTETIKGAILKAISEL